MTETIRMTNLGPLHDLLLRACPANSEGTKSIPILAVAIGYTPQALYKIIRKSKVSPAAAAKVVEANNDAVALLLNGLDELEDFDQIEEIKQSAVALEDFHPYVYV